MESREVYSCIIAASKHIELARRITKTMLEFAGWSLFMSTTDEMDTGLVFSHHHALDAMDKFPVVQRTRDDG